MYRHMNLKFPMFIVKMYYRGFGKHLYTMSDLDIIVHESMRVKFF